MPAYMLFIREKPVHNAAEMAEYQRLNAASPRDPNLKPLVIYGNTEALEGEAPDGIIMLQFPDVAAAKAWYNSPSYQAAMKHRQLAADYRALIVEGL